MRRWRRLLAIGMAILVLGLSGHAVTASAIVGDVDQNGICNTADVRKLLCALANESVWDDESFASADYNEDGIVNTADARAVICAILGGESSLDEETLLSAAAYNGSPYVVLNDNQPLFSDSEKRSTVPFETYSSLDEFGRCGVAYANICQELMPTEERESISSVYPTGWHNQQYDHVPGGWVYNRCHIIGFQLAGEQANEQNLITGTRYLNTEGMLPFENMIADYVKETDNHVLYRVTPLFAGDDLLAQGVRLEAWSVEDNGEGICVHVFCYNVQPGVVFDYATGENEAADAPPSEDDTPTVTLYILNTNSKKFHVVTCAGAAAISEKNRAEYTGLREDLIADGYSPCGNCKP